MKKLIYWLTFALVRWTRRRIPEYGFMQKGRRGREDYAVSKCRRTIIINIAVEGI